MDDLARLVTDLQTAGRSASRQARGIMAKHLDVAEDRARSAALSSWTKYGRGMEGSAGTIRARMSASVGSRGGDRQLGYLLADGEGVFQAEHGNHDRAPDPVMGQAVEGISGPVETAIADMVEQLL